MPRDYKDQANPAPRRRRRRHASCWLWFSSGVLCGALGILLVSRMQSKETPEITPDTPPEIAENLAKRPMPLPQFDYQRLLRELKVVVPQESADQHPPALPPPEPAEEPESGPKAKEVAVRVTEQRPATHGTHYLLQVASLKDPADAEALRAKLGLRGFSSTTQRIEINGNRYYRVRVGPYEDKAAAKQDLAKLSAQGLHPLLIRSHTD